MLIQTSFDIICSPRPNLKNVHLAYAQKHLEQNVPLTWLKGKNLKHLSVGESFGCSPFWMKQKFFQWETSNNWKTACVAKYALWWAEKLSDSTVFLTLERVYQIYNHKFSQNHASETHGSTDSMVAAGYARECVLKRSLRETPRKLTVIFEWGIWLWQTWWIVMITPAERRILLIPKHVTSRLTKLQAHQYFSGRRLQGKPVYP